MLSWIVTSTERLHVDAIVRTAGADLITLHDRAAHIAVNHDRVMTALIVDGVVDNLNTVGNIIVVVYESNSFVISIVIIVSAKAGRSGIGAVSIVVDIVVGDRDSYLVQVGEDDSATDRVAHLKAGDRNIVTGVLITVFTVGIFNSV